MFLYPVTDELVGELEGYFFVLAIPFFEGDSFEPGFDNLAACFFI